MTLIFETNNPSTLEKMMLFVKSLDDVNIIREDTINTQIPIPTIRKGDKTINPKALFGIWKDKNVTIEEIREKAWKLNDVTREGKTVIAEFSA